MTMLTLGPAENVNVLKVPGRLDTISGRLSQRSGLDIRSEGTTGK